MLFSWPRGMVFLTCQEFLQKGVKQFILDMLEYFVVCSLWKS